MGGPGASDLASENVRHGGLAKRKQYIPLEMSAQIRCHTASSNMSWSGMPMLRISTSVASIPRSLSNFAKESFLVDGPEHSSRTRGRVLEIAAGIELPVPGAPTATEVSPALAFVKPPDLHSEIAPLGGSMSNDTPPTPQFFEASTNAIESAPSRGLSDFAQYPDESADAQELDMASESSQSLRRRFFPPPLRAGPMSSPDPPNLGQLLWGCPDCLHCLHP